MTGDPVKSQRDGRAFLGWLTDSYDPGELPMIGFTDRYDTRYYQYADQTQRFPATASFEDAFPVLRARALSGPQDDQAVSQQDEGQSVSSQPGLHRVTRARRR